MCSEKDACIKAGDGSHLFLELLGGVVVVGPHSADLAVVGGVVGEADLEALVRADLVHLLDHGAVDLVPAGFLVHLHEGKLVDDVALGVAWQLLLELASSVGDAGVELLLVVGVHVLKNRNGDQLVGRDEPVQESLDIFAKVGPAQVGGD